MTRFHHIITAYDPIDLINYHLGRDLLFAFELVAGLIFPWTPKRAEILEINAYIVPLAMTNAGVWVVSGIMRTFDF